MKTNTCNHFQQIEKIANESKQWLSGDHVWDALLLRDFGISRNDEYYDVCFYLYQAYAEFLTMTDAILSWDAQIDFSPANFPDWLKYFPTQQGGVMVEVKEVY